MKYYNVEQGSDSWWELRKGMPTASNAKKILTAKGKLSAQADGYIAELVGQQLSLLTPERIETYTSRAMRHGIETEEEARRFYCLQENCDVLPGGFCVSDDGRFGCSPDFLVRMEVTGYGKDERGKGYDTARVKVTGELKCVQHNTQVTYLLDGNLPDDHRWQAHFALLVTGAERCDWLSYHPGLAPLVVRTEPNDDTLKLAAALEEFHAKYQATLKRVREMA